MVMSGEPSQQRQISSDPHTVRSWGETDELTPVRYEREGTWHLDLLPESEHTAGHETLSWDEFGTQLSENEQIVVREPDSDRIRIVDRSEMVSRMAVESEGVERALLEGETTETEVTERTVVEHVVVEEATVQSEVVDREVIRSDILEADLLSTNVDGVTVTQTESPDESPATVERFRAGATLDEAYDIELTVDENWSLVREVVERFTIESRIADTDVETEETVESDTVSESVDIEDATETILRGELVESPETATQAVESGHVESRFREDDIIETHLIRRQRIDEELGVRKEIFGQLTDGETVTTDAVGHSVVESEIVDADEYDVDLGTHVTTGAEAAATETGTATTAATVTPTDDDVGKEVVNTRGDELGMVVDVESNQMYVDPHASLTDKIRTALGWGDHDEDSYRVDNESIVRIEDDQVVLDVERNR